MSCSPAFDSTPGITLRSPGELLAMIPYLLGFHPTDSMVAVGLRGRRVVFTLRLDLPATGARPVDPVTGGDRHGAGDPSPTPIAERLVPMLSAQVLSGIVLAGFGTDDRVRPLSAELGAALVSAGLPLLDRFRVADTRYWSYECSDPTCCPPEGVSYATVRNRVAAEAVLAGLVALPDRTALTRQLAPVDGAARVAMERATHRAEARRQAMVDSCADPAEAVDRMLAEGMSAVRTAAERYQTLPAAQARLCDDEVARLGLALSDITVRDEAWLLADSGDPAGHRALWTDVVRRVGPKYVPAPAALLGFVCWRSGDAGFGGIALSRALEADPGYSMALLLSQALAAGLPPSSWHPSRPVRGTIGSHATRGNAVRRAD